jgi:hypothetical protein
VRDSGGLCVLHETVIGHEQSPASLRRTAENA